MVFNIWRGAVSSYGSIQPFALPEPAVISVLSQVITTTRTNNAEYRYEDSALPSNQGWSHRFQDLYAYITGRKSQ